MRITISLFFVLFSFFACQSGNSQDAESTPPNREELRADIKKIEQQLRQQKNPNLVDTVKANALIEKSQAFRKAFPKDTLMPRIIFKAADVSRGIGKYQQAIKLWGTAYSFAQDTVIPPQALFLQAFTYDKDLNDAVSASRIYRQFLSAYPNHPLAKDAKLLFDMLVNKESPEDMIKKFKAQEKQ